MAMDIEQDVIRLGQTVIARNRDGRPMAAIVTATDMSPDYAAAPGTATLQVFSPHSGPYIKRDVPMGEGPDTFSPLPK